MPSGPGVIADDLIRELAAAVPPGVASFLLTSRADAEGLVVQQRRARANTLQLVDSVPLANCAVCSGVRTDGRLDPSRLTALLAALA